jgi:hypothetical protein
VAREGKGLEKERERSIWRKKVAGDMVGAGEWQALE